MIQLIIYLGLYILAILAAAYSIYCATGNRLYFYAVAFALFSFMLKHIVIDITKKFKNGK